MAVARHDTRGTGPRQASQTPVGGLSRSICAATDRAPIRAPPAYALEDFAADVRALIAAITEDPVVVGASLGGIASLLALTESPAAPAAGLVLVDVAHRCSPPSPA